MFKILHASQFVVSHLEITHCSSESLKLKASCKWTEQRWIRKFVFRVVIWVSSVVRPLKWSCVKAAILVQGENFCEHCYFTGTMWNLIHMSVFNDIGMCRSALHNHSSRTMERSSSLCQLNGKYGPSSSAPQNGHLDMTMRKTSNCFIVICYHLYGSYIYV